MMSRIVQRLCRGVCVQPCRWMSSRKNVPMFWHRREPWDPFNMDSFFSRPFDSHFRDMARIMDGLRQRPFYLEDYVRPKEVAEALAKSEIAEVKYDNKKFEVKMDVSMYKPEELKVTIAEDRLIIHGKHEQKADDHGYVSREFTRQFIIPENIESEGITSTLSEDGMLLIQGRVKGAEEGKERVIDIQKETKGELKGEPTGEPKGE